MTASVDILSDFQRQYDLLKMEYEHERKEYAAKFKLTDINWKIRRGVCWFPLQLGRSYFNSLNQYVVEVTRQPQEENDETEMEYGKPVAFFTQSGKDDPRLNGVTGMVNFVDGDRMVIALSSEGDMDKLRTAENIGVQLYFDESTYQLMFGAILRVMNAKDGRLAKLRDIIKGNQKAEFHNNAPIRMPWLNQSQEDAVNMVLNAKDVAIVHGPPGTGKTTTLVEAIFETLRRESQVLVCAQSNMAVDWISEQLQDRGINVLRIGNPSRVTDKMLAATYERQFENHPSYHELWSLRQAIRQLYSQSAGNRRTVHDKVARLRDRCNAIEIAIRQDLVDNSRVVACTLTGSANRLLEGMKFGSLFIDEAAQALEPACWIAIRKASRVILAGDHCQLPPTIKCIDAARGGLAITLMEKLVRQKPECVRLLDTQYRMCRQIVEFPSKWFYHGMLKSDDMVSTRNILQFDYPLVWIDTSGMDMHEEVTADNAGRSNADEAQLLMDTLQGYALQVGVKRILDEKIDFGVISPYKQQVYTLRRMLKSCAELKSVRRMITVNTIDGFQGQERDVIMISLVRANDDGNIGFLSELRRMNVAITRARMKLVIIGDADTLTRHKFYKTLYEHVQQNGVVMRPDVLRRPL